MNTRKIHPAELNKGDTILINGEMKTVGPSTVKAGFCGTLVNGERMSEVEQVLFPRWFKGEIKGYYPQV